MAKKVFLYIILALTLIMGVNALSGAINIVETGLTVTGNPGTTNTSKYFTAQNLATSTLDGVASNCSNLYGGSGTIPGSAISFVPSTYSLPGSGTYTVAIAASIPSGQRADSYVGSITTYLGDTNQDSVPFTITVNPVVGYTATATSPSMVQGSTGMITVNVTNTGNAPIPYPSGTGLRYTVMDPFVYNSNLLDVTSVATSTINIGYGASNSFNIMFNPSTTQPTGTYAGQVNLSYGGVNITLPLITTITPIIRQMSGSVTTGGIVINRNTSSVFRTIPATLTLNNTGNYPLSGVTISVSSLVGSGGTIPGTSISISDNGFALALGAGRTITLTPASTVYASGTYSGTITVSYGGTSTLSVPFLVTVSDAVASVSLPEVIYPSSVRDVNVTQTITITNNGDYALTGITLTTTAPKTWVTTAVPGSLAVGASFTATLMSSVPEDANGGTYKIGDLVFHSNEIASRTSAIRTNAASKLAFDTVKVSLEDGSWKNINNGATLSDDAKPGDKFGVKLKLENLYTDDEDVDMEVDVTALFKGAGTDGDDIEGDSDSIDIKAGDKSSEFEITFDEDTIDWEASSGKLVMELTATGDDDNGALHTATYNFSINVKRSTSSEIVFTRFEATSTVSCGNSFILYVDGRSVGDDSEDEVVLEIDNDNLGIDIQEKFSMGAYDGDEDCDAIDEGEDSSCREFSYSKSIQIPAGMAPGTYTIEGRLYINDGGKQTDDDNFDLNVQCRSSTTTTDEEETHTTTAGTTTTTTTTQTTTAGTTKKPTTTVPGATTSTVDVMYGGGKTTSTKGVSASMPTRITDTTRQKGFSDSNGYVALLSIMSVLLIIGIIVLLVYAFSRPAE